MHVERNLRSNPTHMTLRILLARNPSARKLTCLNRAGALVGPPWEKRQNGYLLREATEGGVSLFYEPHCDYSGESVQRNVPGPVDVLVAPILNQNLIAYPLV